MKFITFVLTAAVLLRPLPVQAEPQLLSYDELVHEAFLVSPEAAKIDSGLAERAADAFAFRTKENPVLEAGIDLPVNRPSGEESELSVKISQVLRRSDFGERAAVSHLINESAGNERILALNEFVLNLNVLYARAWQLQETEAILSEARVRAQQVLKKVSDGASRGLILEGDVELFKAELKSFEAEGIAARSEFALAKAELTRLSGVPLHNKKFLKPATGISLQRDELIKLVHENKLPVQQRYGLLRRLSEKQLEVARLDSLPAISPEIGYGRHDDGISQVMIGVSVSLPFFNRNEGEKIRSEAALTAAKKGEAYATSAAIDAEVLLLFDTVVTTGEQIALFENGVLPARSRAVDAYTRQFNAGSGSTFQLWQAQRELNNSRLRALELQKSLSGVKAQLSALIGQQQF